MDSLPLLDCAGRLRSPATTSSFHRGRPPRNKGRRYPADPPTVAEIIAVMRAAGERPDGVRLRGVVVVLWRAGLRISEALALAETDLDRDRGSILVRRGKGASGARWGWTAGAGRVWSPGFSSPRCICAGSTAPRSSTPSTNAARR
jgi:integrase